MLYIARLIWDEWNIAHIVHHRVTPKEVEEVCHRHYHIRKSYRKRVLIIGKTKAGRTLAIVLSPEDRNLKRYGEGIYYVVTAFEKGVKP
jgi:hypothetical protein